MISIERLKKIIMLNLDNNPNNNKIAKNMALQIKVELNRLERYRTADLTYNVIKRTIILDDLIGDIIKTALGLEPDWVGIGISGEYKYILKNKREIELFERYFLDMGWFTKFRILKDISKNVGDKKGLGKSFEKKFREFYGIRNMFAHRISPIPKLNKQKDNITEVSLKDLNEKHLKLYNELTYILVKRFYSNVYLATK